MTPARKPDEVYEQFKQGIDALRDEQLVELLNEPCDMSDLDDLEQPVSIIDPGHFFGCGDGSWLATTEDCKFTLLTRLALAGRKHAFELVRETCRGDSPIPSLDGSYIPLPASDVFAVDYQEYEHAEEPSRVREAVISGAAATEAAAAWPFDDGGYIEALSGNTSFYDIYFDLDALTFDSLAASAKSINEEVAIELPIKDFHGEELKDTSLTRHLRYEAAELGTCTAEVFGNRIKDPAIVTLNIKAELG